MMKIEFNGLRIAAIAAVFATALIPSLAQSTATLQPPALATTDLSNEQRIIAKYFDDLVAYENEVEKLNKRKALEHIHINPVQLKADDLKSRLSGVQNAVREIVKKLKAANQWESLDETLLAGITDARQKSFLQEVSAKRLLETAADNLSSRSGDINRPLDNLRKKLTSRYGPGADAQFVRARYEAPVPFGSKDSLGCYAGRAMLVAIKLAGGTPTNAAYDAVFHQCWPEGSVSPF